MKKLLITSLMALSVQAWAQTTVKVEDAWVRGTVATQKASGAFMRLTPSANTRLVGVRSPVAGVVEIHEMAMENDVMKMREVPGLDLAAGRTMELKPGGYHVMLMDLKKEIPVGSSVPLQLKFEDAQGKTSVLSLHVPAALAPASQGHAHGAAMPAMKDGQPDHSAHKH